VIDGLEDLYAAFMDRDPINAGDRMAAFIGAAEQAFFAARKNSAGSVELDEPTSELPHLRAASA
jgi:hypothetical protein